MFFTNDCIEIQPTYDLENIRSKYAFENILKGFFSFTKNFTYLSITNFYHIKYKQRININFYPIQK
jgi:hypothetical protein